MLVMAPLSHASNGIVEAMLSMTRCCYQVMLAMALSK
jgi:hypothetical protein